MNPTLPTPTLHGTSFQSLCEDYEKARLAVEEAANAISQIEFNSRDYTSETWYEAVAERADIFKKLGEVRTYLMTHAEHCANLQ